MTIPEERENGKFQFVSSQGKPSISVKSKKRKKKKKERKYFYNENIEEERNW